MFLAAEREIPYAVAVTIDQWQERIADHGKRRGERIGSRLRRGAIHVEKAGSEKDLVGERGR